MRRLFSVLAALLIGLSPAVPAPLGKATILFGCVPVTYPSSPLYQSLALSDSWGGNDSTRATNALVSPACATTGLSLTEGSGATTQHSAQKGTAIVLAASAYTVTAYAKQVIGIRNVQFEIDNSAFASGAFQVFGLSPCSIIGGGTTYGTWSGFSSTATSWGKGWCKLTLTFTAAIDTGPFISFYMYNGSTTYTGDGASRIGLWGVDFR